MKQLFFLQLLLVLFSSQLNAQKVGNEGLKGLSNLKLFVNEVDELNAYGSVHEISIDYLNFYIVDKLTNAGIPISEAKSVEGSPMLTFSLDLTRSKSEEGYSFNIYQCHLDVISTVCDNRIFLYTTSSYGADYNHTRDQLMGKLFGAIDIVIDVFISDWKSVN